MCKVMTVLALVAVTTTAWARDPTPAELRSLYTRLEQARILLARPGTLTSSETSDLRSRVVQGENAIKKFIDTCEQGRARGKLMPVYAGAATVLVADDATVIGTADDALLVVVGAAALITMWATQQPASPPDVDAAWHSAFVVVSYAATLAEEIRRRHAQPLAHAATKSGIPESSALPSAIEAMAKSICRPSDPKRYQCESRFYSDAVECYARRFADKEKQAAELLQCVDKIMNQLKMCCGWATPTSRN